MEKLKNSLGRASLKHRVFRRVLPPAAMVLTFFIGSIFFHDYPWTVAFCTLLTGFLFVVALRYPSEDFRTPY
jgi:hypothetical protein